MIGRFALVILTSTSQTRKTTPSRRAPAGGARIGRIVAGWLGVGGAILAACTLTADDYHPPIAVTEPLEPGDAGSGGSDTSGTAGGGGNGTSGGSSASESGGGQDAGGCGSGVECCTAEGCSAGQVCLAGACAPIELADAGCVGPDCPAETPAPVAPSCDDGERNGDETGSDCGGSCALGCAVGIACRLDTDCAEGLLCSPQASLCAEPSCNDGVQNGDELAEDCGGGACPGCLDGAPCNAGTDCESGVCGADDTCVAPSCDDSRQNGDETAVDCGGSCPGNCPDAAGCEVAGDCQSGVCDDAGCDDGLDRCCQAPSCDDDVQNGGESDTDCGTAACGGCAVGDRCAFGFQCATNQCTGGVCAAVPTCTDRVQNGTESDVDCGGTCGRCPDLSDCNQPADCVNSNCLDGTCISCGDMTQNGTETGIDCGGADPFCRRCNAGEPCLSNADCASQLCIGGACT